MSDIVIRVENLGKSYIIGHEKREHYVALRDVLANKVKQIAGKTRQIFHGGQLIAGNELEEFWALKDINFEIKQGDRLGIIGRNGAGKSTLLKVLSRITEPTTGRIQIKGRVASLLEVGTGFHPELSGRENVYLNGAILGMSRVEIKNKFDEIVDFSGVEKFLDTPVKRYSSGMYVRLAFAVAANLESEILIVDEVLAVGDAEFQKKCLGKMGDISKGEGRTVLFVSHNMAAVQTLCKTGLLLVNGNIAINDEIKTVIDQYNNSFISQIVNEKFTITHSKEAEFSEISIINRRNTYTFTTDEAICIEIGIIVNNFAINADVLLFLNSIETQKRITLIETPLIIDPKKNNYKIRVTIPKEFLMTGKYYCEIGILNLINGYYDHRSGVACFDVIYGNNNFIKYGNREIGYVFPPEFLIETIFNDADL